jgi:hypothetical protein
MSKPEKATINGHGGWWPDAETAASVMRAREILAAGVAQIAIEKARRCS